MACLRRATLVGLDFGEKIGPKERYTIERKLGWGMHSSTWLKRHIHRHQGLDGPLHGHGQQGHLF